MILFLFFGQIVLHQSQHNTCVALSLSWMCGKTILQILLYSYINIYIYIYIYHLPIDVIMSVMGEFKKRQLKKFQISILGLFF